MKTKTDFLSRVLYRRVLFILFARARYLAAVSLMLVAVLLTCYSAVANAPRGGTQDATNEAGLSSEADDRDPEYRQKRHEFLKGFFGTGPEGVSPSAYMAALDAAQALPPSPLL